jgi:hypothetical protein
MSNSLVGVFLNFTIVTGEWIGSTNTLSSKYILDPPPRGETSKSLSSFFTDERDRTDCPPGCFMKKGE